MSDANGGSGTPRSGPGGLVPPSLPRTPVMAGMSSDADVGDAGDSGEGGQPPRGTPPPPAPTIDPALIDGLPPTGDGDAGDAGDSGDAGDGAGGSAPDDFSQIMQRFEDRMQRRFDRAITRAVKGIQQGQGQGGPPPANGSANGAGDGGSDAGGQPPVRQPTYQPVSQPLPDVRSIKLLVRDRIADDMEKSGSTERRVVKDVLDHVVGAIDWSRVDDEDEFIGELVAKLKTGSESLIKTGSDRKVAQLRTMGLIPAKQGQPASHQGGTGAPAPTAMARGAEAARQRWPAGKRRMGG